MKSPSRQHYIFLALCATMLWLTWSIPALCQCPSACPKAGATPTSETLATGQEQKLIYPVEKPGLANCYRLTKDFYRGAQPTVTGFRELKKLGVKTVINLRHYHSDENLLKGTGLDLVEVHMDAHDIDLDNLVEVFKVLGDPERYPVFVHCQHGSDRTGLVSALYRIAYRQWPCDRAYEEMVEGPFGFHTIRKNIEHTLKTLDVEKLKTRANTARKKEKQQAAARQNPAGKAITEK